MTVRIGIVGTGFVSRHFILALENHSNFAVTHVLTRRNIDSCTDYPDRSLLTNSPQQLIENADCIFECSGDPVHAAEIVNLAQAIDLPVVTMNPEFHVTAGSYFTGSGLLTEAEGDQPGCIAALKSEAEELGFKPLVLGNIKGFLNHNPTIKEMRYWANRQGISMQMVVASTDGTKLQLEQALVANGLGATIIQPGLVGPELDDLSSAGQQLAQHAEEIGQPVSDYVLSSRLPHGVFVCAKHDERQRDCLKYLKLGEGPYYILLKPNIFVHLEVIKTIKNVLSSKKPLLNNSECPRVSVAAVAKREITESSCIVNGIGSFDVRGMAILIKNFPGHMPIGLIQNAIVKRRITKGQILTFDDLEIPETLALRAWLSTEQKVLSQETDLVQPSAPVFLRS